jgi:hypothetical protein
MRSGERGGLGMSGIFGWLHLVSTKGEEKMPLGQAHSMLQFFEKQPITHSEENEIGDIRSMYASLARWIEATLPQNPERTTALRKLLESKDCAVRARIFKGP